MDTVAVAAPGFRDAIAQNGDREPDAPPRCGMNGLKASSETRTGRRESWNSIRASGNSPVNVAACQPAQSPARSPDQVRRYLRKAA